MGFVSRLGQFAALSSGFVFATSAIATMPLVTEQAKVAQLAKKFLSPTSAASIVAFQLADPVLPGQQSTSITFFTRAKVGAFGICRRDAYIVPLAHDSDVGMLPSRQGQTEKYVKLTYAKNCQSSEIDNFGHLQPSAASEKGAIMAMHILQEAQTEAKGVGRVMRSQLSCASESIPKSCDVGPRKTLESLPLNHLFIITPLESNIWSLAIMPSGPGHRYWDIHVSDIYKKKPSIVMNLIEEPPPF
jgi:hypothetical protein